jgi:hypothetical protein
MVCDDDDDDGDRPAVPARSEKAARDALSSVISGPVDITLGCDDPASGSSTTPMVAMVDRALLVPGADGDCDDDVAPAPESPFPPSPTWPSPPPLFPLLPAAEREEEEELPLPFAVLLIAT